MCTGASPAPSQREGPSRASKMALRARSILAASGSSAWCAGSCLSTRGTPRVRRAAGRGRPGAAGRGRTPAGRARPAGAGARRRVAAAMAPLRAPGASKSPQAGGGAGERPLGGATVVLLGQPGPSQEPAMGRGRSRWWTRFCRGFVPTLWRGWWRAGGKRPAARPRERREPGSRLTALGGNRSARRRRAHMGAAPAQRRRARRCCRPRAARAGRRTPCAARRGARPARDLGGGAPIAGGGGRRRRRAPQALTRAPRRPLASSPDRS
jgi:hypothetical protein